jgi:hypothetical protein
MPTDGNTTVPYEMRTEAGRTALARRAAALAARKLDLAIEGRLEQLRESDPVICALAALRRVALALPSELLRRGWIPALAGVDDVVWRPPEVE